MVHLKLNSMKTLKLISFALFPLCGLAQNPNYVADKTIPLTGNGGYDYGTVLWLT